MSREFPSAPLVGVGGVVIEDGRVLLIRRGQAPLLGEWSLPGGLLECGETLREAVVREVLEETALAVEATTMLGVYERVTRSDDGRVRYHYVLIDFLCHRVDGALNAGSDAAEAGWFLQHNLADLALPGDTLGVIRRGFQAATS